VSGEEIHGEMSLVCPSAVDIRAIDRAPFFQRVIFSILDDAAWRRACHERSVASACKDDMSDSVALNRRHVSVPDDTSTDLSYRFACMSGRSES